MTAAIALPTTAQIRSAIAGAAAKTGVDFDYLLTTAKRESGLKTQAKATTSSASGLFQFIDQTWMSVMKQHGAKHGLKDLAGKIERTDTGRLTIADPAAREEILALRHDPKTASLMAAELTSDAANALKGKLGRAASKGELYMAHFLGTTGAARFIEAAEANPDTRAATMFGREAAANRSVFYEKSGAMRSLKDVYNRLAHTHDDKAARPEAVANTATEYASAPGHDFVSSRPYASGSYQGHYAPVSTSSLLAGLTSTLTPQVMMILASLDLPFGDD